MVFAVFEEEWNQTASAEAPNEDKQNADCVGKSSDFSLHDGHVVDTALPALSFVGIDVEGGDGSLEPWLLLVYVLLRLLLLLLLLIVMAWRWHAVRIRVWSQ